MELPEVENESICRSNQKNAGITTTSLVSITWDSTDQPYRGSAKKKKQLFQTDILVYHSGMNNQERVEIWNAVLAGAKIVVGARSSIFLPFIHLGLSLLTKSTIHLISKWNRHLVTMPETQPCTRRSCTKNHVLLGSATPSIESMFNAKSNKYSIFTPRSKIREATMPTIKIIDLRKEYKDKRFDGLFSGQLLEEMKSTH